MPAGQGVDGMKRANGNKTGGMEVFLLEPV